MESRSVYTVRVWSCGSTDWGDVYYDLVYNEDAWDVQGSTTSRTWKGSAREVWIGQMKSNSPVIIMGMHRSGTSMLTRQLHALGIHMGKDLTINAESRCFQELNRGLLAEGGGSWSHIAPVLSKMESGDYVQQQAVEIRERLLRKNAISTFWSARQKVSLTIGIGPVHWGWKDPRNSITLPIWLTVFPNARVIHVIRNGIDVAISLHRRESNRARLSRDYCERCLDFGYCFQLWEQYTQACRWHVRDLHDGRYLELRYEEILQTPENTLRAALGFLGHNVSEGIV